MQFQTVLYIGIASNVFDLIDIISFIEEFNFQGFSVHFVQITFILLLFEVCM